MPILAITSSKGGVGKTTLAICLADFWRQNGKKVSCLDTDPNSNLDAWIRGAKLPNVTCSAIGEEEVIEASLKASESSDIVIIDVAGFLARGMLYAVGVAGAVLVPTKAAKGDVHEALRTQQVITSAMRLSGRRIAYSAILTQVNRRAQVTSHTRQQFTALGFPALSSELAMRTAYQVAWYQDQSPLDVNDNGVIEDVKAIANEAWTLLESSENGTA